MHESLENHLCEEFPNTLYTVASKLFRIRRILDNSCGQIVNNFHFSRTFSFNYIATILYSWVVNGVFYVGRLNKFELLVQILRQEHGCRWFTMMVPKCASEELVNVKEREKPVKNVLQGMDRKYAQMGRNPVGNLLRNCLEYVSESPLLGDRGIYPLFPIPIGWELISRDANIPPLLGHVFCVWPNDARKKSSGREDKRYIFWGGTCQYSGSSFHLQLQGSSHGLSGCGAE